MRLICLLAVCFGLVGFAAFAQDKSGNEYTIGEGKLALTVPASWTKKEPASRIVEVEFAIPPAKGDESPGRLTAMGAGGSIEDNVNRWVGQFVGAGGSAAKPQRDKANVSVAEVEIVDLSGIYKAPLDGLFVVGKTINRDNYVMPGAIIQTKDRGNYFLKLYGPKATIDENAKGFQDMVKSLKVK